MKDQVYSQPLEHVEAFRFDNQVADVFENMINRSVPGYSLLLDVIGMITERYAQPDTHCYDLGCSLGASTLMVRRHLPASCHVVGVDNSAAMVARCRTNVDRDHSQASIEIREGSLQTTPISNASLVVINFTLQFIDDIERQPLLQRIADNMNKGGALLLSEKVCFKDAEMQAQMTDLHHEFKRYNGYSDLEIAQKRAAIENVLVPNTQQQHLARLEAAGFGSAKVIFRCFNFISILAVK